MGLFDRLFGRSVSAALFTVKSDADAGPDALPMEQRQALTAGLNKLVPTLERKLGKERFASLAYEQKLQLATRAYMTSVDKAVAEFRARS